MALKVLFLGVSSAWPGDGEDTAWNAAVNMQTHGARPTDVDYVFFTHCHQDHTMGFPGLFFANMHRAKKRP